MIKISRYTTEDPDIHAGIIALIVGTQREEFGLPLTYEDQPDLSNISEFYTGFWVALDENNNVLGTIGLIQLGESGVIRKMFVEKGHRGPELGIAQKLFEILERYCQDLGITNLCLDTVIEFRAAHRFYQRNGFHEIAVAQLPIGYPTVAPGIAMDRMYFQKPL